MIRGARGAKVTRNPELAKYVIDRFAAPWSPKQIAGYVRRHRVEGLSICHINMSMAAKLVARDGGAICRAPVGRDGSAMPESRAVFIFRWPP